MRFQILGRLERLEDFCKLTDGSVIISKDVVFFTLLSFSTIVQVGEWIVSAELSLRHALWHSYIVERQSSEQL